MHTRCHMFVHFQTQVLVTVPSRVLLEQFAQEMPKFCKAGMGYNDKLDIASEGFISVTDSVHLLQKLEFEAIYVDEAHHPLPKGFPSCKNLYKFSATHQEQVDFRYSLGEAIEQGVLCDYDLTVPVVTEGHPYICLANLLLSQAGRFRRVLAYCNSIAEARRFQQVLETVGLEAWHINARTSRKMREKVMDEFSGELQKPVHVLVTVQVLGEGVNIPNADTCMFVEPKRSYISIIQAIGRVLRPHPLKPMAHLVLPAIAMQVASTTPDKAHGAWDDSFDSARAAQSVGTASALVEHDHIQQSNAAQSEQGNMHAAKNENKTSKTIDFTENTRQFCGSRLKEESTESSGDAKTAGSGGMPNAYQSEPAQLGPVATGKLPQSASSGETLPAPLRAEYGDDTRGPPLQRSSQADNTNGAKLSGPRSCSDDRQKDELQGGLQQRAEAVLPQHHDVLFESHKLPVQDAHSARARSSGQKLLAQAAALEAVPHAMSRSARSHRAEAASPRSRLLHPGASIEREDVRCRASNSRSKVRPTGDTGLFGRGNAGQLERFLEAIAKADSRFADKEIKHLQSRVWVMDCRLQQPTMQHLVAQDVHYRLALILQQRDPWDVRLQAVEQFDQDHGKLPRGNRLEERGLALWLRDAGTRMKRQELSATRMQKLLDTPCTRLRARVAKWLIPETAFEPTPERVAAIR